MKFFRRLLWMSLAFSLVHGVSQVQAETAGGNDELSKLNDEFYDPQTAERWQRIEQVEQWNANQLELFDINNIYKGSCAMMPYTSTWYCDYRGVLVFKPIKGDFVMTTRVRVTGRDGKSAPNSTFSLAGIMVRTPRDITPETWRPGGENYIFLSLGAADRNGVYQFEYKTTVNSDSKLRTEEAGTGDAQLQIARMGEAIVVLAKTPQGAWRVLSRYRRPDFPAELQCGMTCYTDYPSASQLPARQHNATVIKTGRPDLGALYDYVRYQRPRVPVDLKGRNFADANQVPDAQLLTFLGESVAGARSETAPGFATGAAKE